MTDNTSFHIIYKSVSVSDTTLYVCNFRSRHNEVGVLGDIEDDIPYIQPSASHEKIRSLVECARHANVKMQLLIEFTGKSN